MPLNKTRLTYLWLLPLNFTPPPLSIEPTFSPFVLSSFFCIFFFLSLRWFPLLSIAFPSFVSFHFTVFFLRCIYHRTCRCCSYVCLHSTRLKPRPVLVQRSRGNEHPFWDSHGFRQGYFTPSTTNGMNSNSFRVSVSLCGRCFKEEDRSPREGQDRGG